MSYADTAVWADALQARGDPRGELLALELAAELATSSDEARRLNRAAQRVRELHPRRVWPAALHDSSARMRAGFVVALDYGDLPLDEDYRALLLGLRALDVDAHHRLEDCMSTLSGAWRAGLRLHRLRQRTAPQGPPTALERLREIVDASGGELLDELVLSGAVGNIAALARVSSLQRLTLGSTLTEAQLCTLAGLPLRHLGLAGPTLDPVIVPLFGNTLTSLQLRDTVASLAPLSSLPWLSQLALFREYADLGVLCSSTRLEHLQLAGVRTPGQLAALRSLPLRHLQILTMDAPLVDELADLRGLESLSVRETSRDSPLALAPLAALPQLRRLSLPRHIHGQLRLRPGFARLSVTAAEQPLAIDGEVDELVLTDSALSCLPASLLARVRKLRLVWRQSAREGELDALPRLCPQLEQLSIANSCDRAGQWRWRNAPAVFDALTHLRSFDILGTTVLERAEIAGAFPMLCPLGAPDIRDEPQLWPWTRAPRQARVEVVPPVVPKRESNDQAAPYVELREAMAPLLTQLRARHDPRAELLELELAAEFEPDAGEARRLASCAHQLRRRASREAWPPRLRNDVALLRGGLPIRSTAEWLSHRSIPAHELVSLRSVSVGKPHDFEVSTSNLARGTRVGMSLAHLDVSVAINAPSLAFPRFGVRSGATATLPELADLAALTGLASLELGAPLDRRLLRQFPNFALQHLGLCAENFDRVWLERYADTLTSLELGPLAPSRWDALELPRLEHLRITSCGNLDWIVAQPGLRALELNHEPEGQVRADELERLAGLALEHLCVEAPPEQIARLLACRLEVASLFAFSSARLPDFDPAWLARNTRLRALGLGANGLNRSFELPQTLDLLVCVGDVLPRVMTRSLTCDPETLGQLQPDVGAGVEHLCLVHEPDEQLPLERHVPHLQSLQLLGFAALQPAARARLLGQLRAMPHLRRVVLDGLKVGEVAELSSLAPELQLHGTPPSDGASELDWQSPESWPVPVWLDRG